MKIYTKIVLDMATLKTIEVEGFEYSGAVAFCSSGGGGYSPPPPTDEEEYIQEMQIRSLERKEEQAELMEPLIYENMGYKKVLTIPDAVVDLNTKIQDIDSQLSSISGFDVKEGESYADRVKRLEVEMQDPNSQYSQNADLRADLEAEKEKLSKKRDYAFEHKRAEYSLEKLPEEVDELQEMYEERQIAAMKGELPISPAMEREIAEQKASKMETLSRKLGPDYAATTAGIQSMSQFNTDVELMREEARRGAISQGEALLSSRTASLAGLEQQEFQSLSHMGKSPTSSDYLSSLQPFQEQRQAEFQGTVAESQAKAASRASNISSGVSLAGTVAVIGIAI